jgi:hypothetical protein
MNTIRHKVLNSATRVTFSVAILFAASLFTACDDDDDNGIGSVAGSWVGDKTELNIRVEGIPAPINEVDDSFAGEVDFQADGTALYSEDGEEIEGTWVQNHNKLILTIPTSDEFDMSGTYTIQELTPSRLKLHIEKETSFEDPDTGMVFDATVKATLYFNKD